VAPRKISAKDLVADIKAQRPDDELKAKYGLSSEGLQRLFQQLLEKELIQESDLARREEVVLQVDIVEEPSAPDPSRPGANRSDTSSSETDSLKRLLAESASGNQEKVQELLDNILAFLDRGADVNTKSDDGYTALMLAAGWGRSDLVKLLLDRGSDVNAENSQGMTALMNCSLWGHKEVVSLLLDRGADIHAQSKEGWTAIRLASSKKHHEIVKFLRNHGARDVQTRPLSDISPYYLRVFQRMETEGKTRIPNIYALVLPLFWGCYKGMWKKGIVYIGATVLIDMSCEIILRHNFGLIIAAIFACLFGNWDYYLYRLHGEAFFTKRWWDGVRSGKFINVDKVVETVSTDQMVSQIPGQVEKYDRKIGFILGSLSLLILLSVAMGS